MEKSSQSAGTTYNIRHIAVYAPVNATECAADCSSNVSNQFSSAPGRSITDRAQPARNVPLRIAARANVMPETGTDVTKYIQQPPLH